MYNSKGIFVGGFILFHLILFFTYWGLDPNPYLEKQRCGQKKSFFKRDKPRAWAEGWGNMEKAGSCFRGKQLPWKGFFQFVHPLSIFDLCSCEETRERMEREIIANNHEKHLSGSF